MAEQTTQPMQPINPSAATAQQMQGISSVSGGYQKPSSAYTAQELWQEPAGQNWWQRNQSWISPLLTIGGSALGSLAGPLGTVLLGGLTTGLNAYFTNKANEKLYEKQKQDQIEAENRANSEYDRRLADQREYENNWDERLREKGINPMTAMQKGGAVVTGSNASAPAPSPSGAPSALPTQSLDLSSMLQALQIRSMLEKNAADIENTEAQTENIKAQTEGQNLENQFYSESTRTAIDKMLSDIRLNQSADEANRIQTAIRGVELEIAQATKTFDIDRCQYELQYLQNTLKQQGLSFEQAKLTLESTRKDIIMKSIQAQLGIQHLRLGNVTIDLQKLTYDQMLAEFKAKRDLLPKFVQADLDALLLANEKAEKEGNWYGFNQVIGGLASTVNSAANLVNAVKPGISIGTTTTTTYGEFGNVTGHTVTETSGRRR